jgi:hypothetical protein
MRFPVTHPLAVFLAAPAEPTVGPDEELPYDPVTQLQAQWNDIPDHLEILCSGERTGDPDTRSGTTEVRGYPSSTTDDDTDDSGT